MTSTILGRIVIQLHLAFAIPRDTPAEEHIGLRGICLNRKLTKEDAGRWRMFQRWNLEIRIKTWRQLDTKYRTRATVRDVFHAIETSAFEFRIGHQGAG